MYIFNINSVTQVYRSVFSLLMDKILKEKYFKLSIYYKTYNI